MTCEQNAEIQNIETVVIQSLLCLKGLGTGYCVLEQVKTRMSKWRAEGSSVLGCHTLVVTSVCPLNANDAVSTFTHSSLFPKLQQLIVPYLLLLFTNISLQ
jgi:hypothetical protein